MEAINQMVCVFHLAIVCRAVKCGGWGVEDISGADVEMVGLPLDPLTIAPLTRVR